MTCPPEPLCLELPACDESGPNPKCGSTVVFSPPLVDDGEVNRPMSLYLGSSPDAEGTFTVGFLQEGTYLKDQDSFDIPLVALIPAKIHIGVPGSVCPLPTVVAVNTTTNVTDHRGWFEFTATSEGTAIETCGSDFNSILEVWTEDCATLLAANDDCDDSPSGAGSDSLASCYNDLANFESCLCLNTTPGHTYKVHVREYDSPGPPPGGTINLTITERTVDTLHVPGDYPTIQQAIDGACFGNEIIVAPGTYPERIDFHGKAITVRSSDGPEVTTIDATGLSASVVKCVNGEGPDTVLDGFTITGGTGTDPGSGYYYGGGMYNWNSSPTVTNCTFSGNMADLNGGGIYNGSASSPTVTNCTFSANEANQGAGMYSSSASPTVTNCTFSGNSADSDGGGMFNWSSSPTVANCKFSENSASSEGGGLYNYSESDPEVTNCTFSGNSAMFGGGIYNGSASSPTVTNCTFSGNTSTQGGGILNADCVPTVTNCILWGNTGGEIVNVGTGDATVTYSDVQGGYTGTGNIDTDPLFVDAAGGNLQLGSFSPCIDAGNNAAAAAVTTDLAGNPRFVDDLAVADTGPGTPPIVDMGAYERQADSGATLYVDVLGDDAWDGLAPEWDGMHGPKRTIQVAIGAACDEGNEIVVAPGTYEEAIDFVGKAITLRSSDGPEVTTIDATGLSASVVRCVSGEGPDTVLDGFTTTGGTGTDLGGGDTRGGGMYNLSSSPTVTNCAFSGNTASNSGGGMYNYPSSPTVSNCTFSGNSTDAAGRGGAMFNFDNSDLTVINCIFSGNTAGTGGGMYNYSVGSPALTNCTFSGNTAVVGGGMYNAYSSSPAVTNCTFSGNSATDYGGGMYNDSSNPTVTNCILWGDTATTGAEIYNDNSTPIVTYSDVQAGHSGVGNIDADPLFLNPGAGDLRLGSLSPCIDAGNNAAAAAVTTDLAGNPRFVDDPTVGDTGVGTPPIVDMGAYEGQRDSPAIILYVDDDGHPAAGCASWADACPDLQTALTLALSGDQIWVATGTYKPDAGIGDRTATFQLITGVEVYGGFDGTKTSLGERAGLFDQTILNGDIGTLGDNSDNSYHVVTGSGTDVTAAIDGFTITGGNADGSHPYNKGAGMYNESGDPTVTNCTFSGNWALDLGGGGMLN